MNAPAPRSQPDSPELRHTPTQEYILRAMATNYAPDRFIGDRLDIEVFTKAADEIASLKSQIELMTKTLRYARVVPEAQRKALLELADDLDREGIDNESAGSFGPAIIIKPEFRARLSAALRQAAKEREPSKPLADQAFKSAELLESDVDMTRERRDFMAAQLRRALEGIPTAKEAEQPGYTQYTGYRP